MDIKQELQVVVQEIHGLQETFQAAELKIAANQSLNPKDLDFYTQVMQTVRLKIQWLDERLHEIEKRATDLQIVRK